MKMGWLSAKAEMETIDAKAQDARRMFEARLITRKELRTILNDLEAWDDGLARGI